MKRSCSYDTVYSTGNTSAFSHSLRRIKSSTTSIASNCFENNYTYQPFALMFQAFPDYETNARCFHSHCNYATMKRSCSYDTICSTRSRDTFSHSLRRVKSLALSLASTCASSEESYIYQPPVMMSSILRGYNTNELLSILRSLRDESFRDGAVVALPDIVPGQGARVSVTEIIAEIIARRDRHPQHHPDHHDQYCSFDEDFDSIMMPRRFPLYFFWLETVTVYKKIRAKYCSFATAVSILTILSLILFSIIVPIVVAGDGSKTKPLPTKPPNDGRIIRQMNVSLDCITDPVHFGYACDDPVVMIRYDKIEDEALLTLQARPLNEQYCTNEWTSLVIHRLKLDKCSIDGAPLRLTSKNRCGQQVKYVWCQPHSLHGLIMYCYCTNYAPDNSWTRVYINDSYEDTVQRGPCGMWTYNSKDNRGANVPTTHYCTAQWYEDGAVFWLKKLGKKNSTEVVVEEHRRAILVKAAVDETTDTWAGIYSTSTDNSFCLCEFELSSVKKRLCFDLQTFPSLPGDSHSFHHLLSTWNNTWLVVRHGTFIANGTIFRFVDAHNYDRKGRLLGKTPITLYEQMFPAIHPDGYEFVAHQPRMVNQDLYYNRLLLVYQTGFGDQSRRTAINATVAILSFDF